MTTILQPSPTSIALINGDIRTLQRGRTWAQFKHLQQGFENTHGIRLFFYDGIIEIVMPGKAHELFKSVIGMLIETFLLDRGIEFEPTGSMTQEREGVAAAEADESYQIGDFNLSIEVNFTSGDVSKLDRYLALGVHEVWLWSDAVLKAYHLGAGGYSQVSYSQIPELASIDIAELSTCILLGETSRVKAVQQFRAAHPLT
jgi:Uma2 family endonuclease